MIEIALAALLALQDSPVVVGQEPPELTIPDDGWINSKKPLTLKGLRGRVVWLEFSFLK